MRVRSSRTSTPLLALLIVALLSPLGWSSTASAASGSTVTTKPRQIPIDSAPLPNTMRGQYAWSGQATQPWSQPDVYYRDQVPWSRIEPTKGNFDFTFFDAGLAKARANHGRFSFRVLAWCPGCLDNTYTHAWTQNDWTPSWLAKQPGGNIPDWNSAAFLSSWEDLMQHLAQRYADDPALGSIDVGGYGKYGEWHTDNEGAQITVANAERLTRAVLGNFPRQHVVVNAFKPELVNALLAMSPRLGLRTDCLGAPQMYSLIATAAPGSLLAERWRTAPLLSEWCHSDDDTNKGARQVTHYHVSTVSSANTPRPYADLSADQQAGYRRATQLAGYRYGITSVTVPRTVRSDSTFTLKLTVANTGSAPTYDDWDFVVQLTDAANQPVGEQTLPLPLSAAPPGNRSRTKSVTVPHLKKGKYLLRVVVRDPRGYLDPMWLSDTGRRQNGSYPLAPLVVS